MIQPKLLLQYFVMATLCCFSVQSSDSPDDSHFTDELMQSASYDYVQQYRRILNNLGLPDRDKITHEIPHFPIPNEQLDEKERKAKVSILFHLTIIVSEVVKQLGTEVLFNSKLDRFNTAAWDSIMDFLNFHNTYQGISNRELSSIISKLRALNYEPIYHSVLQHLGLEPIPEEGEQEGPSTIEIPGFPTFDKIPKGQLKTSYKQLLYLQAVIRRITSIMGKEIFLGMAPGTLAENVLKLVKKKYPNYKSKYQHWIEKHDSNLRESGFDDDYSTPATPDIQEFIESNLITPLENMRKMKSFYIEAYSDILRLLELDPTITQPIPVLPFFEKLTEQKFKELMPKISYLQAVIAEGVKQIGNEIFLGMAPNTFNRSAWEAVMEVYPADWEETQQSIDMAEFFRTNLMEPFRIIKEKKHNYNLAY